MDGEYAIIGRQTSVTPLGRDLNSRTVYGFELPFLSGGFRSEFTHSRELYTYDF